MKVIDSKIPIFAQKINNQDGVVLVTALLMLVVLTIMGIAAISIRNTEQSITYNNEVFQHNFYTAEAVTLEGADAIEKLSDAALNTSGSVAWLKLEAIAPDLEFNNNWPTGVGMHKTALTGVNTNIVPVGYNDDGTSAGDRIWSAAIDRGLAAGSSVTYGSGSGGTTKQERAFDVYGIYDVKPGAGKSYHGKMLMVVGYKKQVDTP